MLGTGCISIYLSIHPSISVYVYLYPGHDASWENSSHVIYSWSVRVFFGLARAVATVYPDEIYHIHSYTLIHDVWAHHPTHMGGFWTWGNPENHAVQQDGRTWMIWGTPIFRKPPNMENPLKKTTCSSSHKLGTQDHIGIGLTCCFFTNKR